MKKFLTILTIIAVMFTFSFGSAFAGTFTNDSVGRAVNSAINAVDVTQYLVKSEADINAAKAALIAATETKSDYDSEVTKAINDFNLAIAAIPTIASQKVDLVKEKSDANTKIDNAIMKLQTTIEDELKDLTDDASVQKKATLASDLNVYKTWLKDCVAKVEIIDNRTTFDTEEVDFEAAKIAVEKIVNEMATNSENFYPVREVLNNRTTLNLVADNYAKVLALKFKANATTRLYSDKAIADVTAEVKDKIKFADIKTADEVESYMAKNVVSVDNEVNTDLADYKVKAIESITTGTYALTNYSGTAKTEVAKIQTSYTSYINAANSKSLVDAYVAQAKAAMRDYRSDVQIKDDNDKLTDLDKENKELANKLAKLEMDKKITNLVNAQTDDLKCRSAKTSKGIKITVKGFDASEIIAAGYTVKYTYYRATATGSYKVKLTKDTQTYLNTTGKKGTKYFYKVKISVYDSNGDLVVATKLSDCKKAIRVK